MAEPGRCPNRSTDADHIGDPLRSALHSYRPNLYLDVKSPDAGKRTVHYICPIVSFFLDRTLLGGACRGKQRDQHPDFG